MNSTRAVRIGLRGVLAAGLAAAITLSASTFGSRAAPSAAKAPIKIGFSVSLSGDFSSDGQATLQGYKIWAKNVNSHGGLLGRQVKLTWLDDASSPTQVATNYTKLITQNKVDATFGPFSSLLTIPACAVAARYGYAFYGPAGGGPSVFQQHFTNYIFVQPTPVADNLLSFGQWLMTLPKSKRPKTAAYITQVDPFAQPQINIAKSFLSKHGVKSVYSTVLPEEATDFQPAALGAVHSHAQVVLIGTPGAEPAIALVKAFIQQHYNPKAIIATSGPDQGKTFSDAVGKKHTEAIFVPEDWWAGAKTYQNSLFIKAYLKQYGGKAADISTDSAEAYAVGQVFYQVAKRSHTLNNGKIIKALHKLHFKTVEGPNWFGKYGQPHGQRFLVQWQKGKPLPVYPAKLAVSKPEYPKPNW